MHSFFFRENFGESEQIKAERETPIVFFSEWKQMADKTQATLNNFKGINWILQGVTEFL